MHFAVWLLPTVVHLLLQTDGMNNDHLDWHECLRQALHSMMPQYCYLMVLINNTHSDMRHGAHVCTSAIN